MILVLAKARLAAMGRTSRPQGDPARRCAEVCAHVEHAVNRLSKLATFHEAA